MSRLKTPQSVLSRSKKLMGLALKIGQKEVGHRLSSYLSADDNPLKRLQTQIEEARLLIETLGRLKGAAMKVGQLLSLEAGDFLPPEVVEVLAKLQDQSVAMDFQQVEGLLKTEWGDKRSSLELIEPVARAAASMGQVHRARYRGQDIALKVQYPGIAESIHSDLAILKKVFTALLRVGKKGIDMNPLIDELALVLQQEVDYLQEAQALHKYRELFKDDPNYVVPQVIGELTTSRVLAMSFEEGMGLSAWLKTGPSAEEKLWVGQLVLDAYVKEFFVAGFVQTDPNFANFLYHPPTRKLVLLDLGAHRVYSPEFRREYSELLKLIRGGRDEEMVAASLRMGLIREGEAPATLAAFLKMLKISCEPFAPDSQPFNFGSLDYTQMVRDATLDFIKRVEHSPPPHQLIFLHRKLAGIFSLLKVMDVKMDLVPYWQKLIA